MQFFTVFLTIFTLLSSVQAIRSHYDGLTTTLDAAIGRDIPLPTSLPHNDGLTTTLDAAIGRDIPLPTSLPHNDGLTTTLDAAEGSEVALPFGLAVTTSSLSEVAITTVAPAATTVAGSDHFDGYITLIACKSAVIPLPESLLSLVHTD